MRLHGRRGASECGRLMLNARRQAEDYVRPAKRSHATAPSSRLRRRPLLEVYANFRQTVRRRSMNCLPPCGSTVGALSQRDVLMLNARRQAEDYAHSAERSHATALRHRLRRRPLLRGLRESRQDGKAFDQFSIASVRIYLEDLRQPNVLERLVQIWTEPVSLDPARKSARDARDR
jgi:hypothetical protein